MATESADTVKTVSEIYSVADRSEQVLESAKLLEFALREYSGDYQSSFTQLYNANRKIFEKSLRDRIRTGFDSWKALKSPQKYPEPNFESKTESAEAFIAASSFLFGSYPKIYPQKFLVVPPPPVSDSGFFERGFDAPPATAAESAFANRRNRNNESNPDEMASGPATQPVPPEVTAADSDSQFIPPSYSISSASFFSAKLSIKQLEKLCHRMGRSLKAGVGILRVWETETKAAPSRLQDAFEEVGRDISSGEKLADAVARHACFPGVFCEMVQVGEATGRLDQVFLKMADHYRNLIQMRRTFIQGITWPVLEMGAAVLIISLMFILFSVLEASIANLKAPDLFMLGFSPIGNLMLFWTLVLMMGGGLFLLIKGITSGWFGQLPMRMALRIPLVGNTLKTLSLSRMSWSFGMAIHAGMDAEHAIRLGIRSTNNEYYAAHEDEVAQQVSGGSQFHEALRSVDAFPDDFIEAVEVGEITGEITESLERLSDDYKEQAELDLKKISQICGFLTFLFGAILIGFIVIVLVKKIYLDPIDQALNNPMSTMEQIESGEETDPITAIKNEKVKAFMENNSDFKRIKSLYEVLGEGGGDPNKFLDSLDKVFDENK